MRWKIYFSLTKPARIETDTEIDGVRIGTTLGSKDLVVDPISASTEEEAINHGGTLANTFLDNVAFERDIALEINRNDTSVEWTDQQGQRHSHHILIPRVWDIRLKISSTNASGNVIDIFDSEKPGKTSAKTLGDAASYYRRAKLAEDPFDRFRNFYLVTENIVDRIRLAKSAGRPTEKDLLILALKECFQSDPAGLTNMAAGIPGFQFQGDIYSDVAGFLYEGHRCQVNHSKASKDKKVPFNLKDEEEVRNVLPLMEFVAKSFLNRGIN